MKEKVFIKCLDCPALIRKWRGKVRCIPCADKYSRKKAAERVRKKYVQTI